MTDSILVINAGSSSIKFSLYRGTDERGLEATAVGEVEGIGTAPRFVAKDPKDHVLAERRWPVGHMLEHEDLLGTLLGWVECHLVPGQLSAVGHRVVFGGSSYLTPIRVSPAVMTQLTALVPMMPLHLPHNLAPIRALAKLHPTLTQVACFDTAFHSTMPPVAQLYALPRSLTEDGVRRYGYHGLSYEFIAGELPHYDTRVATGRTVVAHLGNGASLCALHQGRSIATTMGFSALDGLVMGTRPGTLDPGVLLYLIQEKAMEAAAIQRLLYEESGLLGISGISSDMRELLASRDPRAEEAVDLFCYRVCCELGSMTAALGGLDGLVFTAGIGEHATEIRSRICKKAAWLGIVLDAAANEAGGPRISARDSPVSVWVIPTDEDLMIARHTCRVSHIDSEAVTKAPVFVASMPLQRKS